MEPVFNAPVAAVGLTHGLGRHGAGSNQPFGLYAWKFFTGPVDKASQAGSLFHSGKTSLFGGHWKTNQAPGFGPAPIALDALNQIRFR